MDEFISEHGPKLSSDHYKFIKRAEFGRTLDGQLNNLNLSNRSDHCFLLEQIDRSISSSEPSLTFSIRTWKRYFLKSIATTLSPPPPPPSLSLAPTPHLRPAASSPSRFLPPLCRLFALRSIKIKALTVLSVCLCLQRGLEQCHHCLPLPLSNVETSLCCWYKLVQVVSYQKSLYSLCAVKIDEIRGMKLVTSTALFQQVLKTGVTKCRFLGLDVGSKYVGLAVSDEQNKIAIPLSVLERTKKNINLMAQDFQTLVTKLSLAGFVVGYPFKIQGQSTSDAVQVKLFIQELHKTNMLDGVSYTYWDENYTSRCAEALLEPFDFNPVDEKTMLDKFAAVGILQLYLDNMNQRMDSQGWNS